MKKLGIAAGIIFTLIVFGMIIIQQKYSKKTENNDIKLLDIYKRNYKPKYVMYSGHDTTVTALQVFLEKAFDIEVRKIPFASCMMFHLLKDDKENYYVKYFFNDELMLNITFNEFKSQIKKIAWKDYQIEDFCHVFTNKEKLMI